MILPVRILLLMLVVACPANASAQREKASVGKLVVATRHIRHQRFPELADALAALDAGQVEALVYDAPILRFQVVHDYPNLHVLSGVFERQDYAIAMPSGNPLREQANRAVNRVISKRSWDTTFGLPRRAIEVLDERPIVTCQS